MKFYLTYILGLSLEFARDFPLQREGAQYHHQPEASVQLPLENAHEEIIFHRIFQINFHVTSQLMVQNTACKD